MRNTREIYNFYLCEFNNINQCFQNLNVFQNIFHWDFIMFTALTCNRRIQYIKISNFDLNLFFF